MQICSRSRSQGRIGHAPQVRKSSCRSDELQSEEEGTQPATKLLCSSAGEQHAGGGEPLAPVGCFGPFSGSANHLLYLPWLALLCVPANTAPFYATPTDARPSVRESHNFIPHITSSSSRRHILPPTPTSTIFSRTCNSRALTQDDSNPGCAQLGTDDTPTRSSCAPPLFDPSGSRVLS